LGGALEVSLIIQLFDRASTRVAVLQLDRADASLHLSVEDCGILGKRGTSQGQKQDIRQNEGSATHRLLLGRSRIASMVVVAVQCGSS
jgi:hypothetical protein